MYFTDLTFLENFLVTVLNILRAEITVLSLSAKLTRNEEKEKEVIDESSGGVWWKSRFICFLKLSFRKLT